MLILLFVRGNNTMQNKNKGFTIAELIIAILIIGILAIVAVPSYRAHVRKSIATEGTNLLSEIQVGEKAYFYRTGHYLDVASTTKSVPLGVDCRKNKYFTSFRVAKNDTTKMFTATTNAYNGQALTLIGSATSKTVFKDPFTSSGE